jgi:glycosyltransferase A (GT-A) superfamily protein (DUF2064 family)
LSSTARSAAYPRNGVPFGACERASVALSLKGELIPNHVMRPRPAVQHKSSRPAVAVFARAPEPGKVKTRLIPLLGSRGAAEFHSALIRDTLDKVCGESAASYLFLAGRWPHGYGAREAPNTPDQKTAFGADSLRTVAGRCPEIALFQQRGADLGKRLGAAFTRLLRDHPAAVVVGTDSPLMPRRLLREALRELCVCEAVLGPCPDGGYYLIAMRRGKPPSSCIPRFFGMSGGVAGLPYVTRFATCCDPAFHAQSWSRLRTSIVRQTYAGCERN